jgi:hypothetical protein
VRIMKKPSNGKAKAIIKIYNLCCGFLMVAVGLAMIYHVIFEWQELGSDTVDVLGFALLFLVLGSVVIVFNIRESKIW